MADISHNWLIIGSTACYHWFPESRVPRDLDLLTPAKIKTSDSQICFVDAQWHDAASYLISVNNDEVFADPDILYTLKVSHAAWDIKWDKTMYDISFLQSKGCKLMPELYDKLYAVWIEVHGKKRVNMNKPMTEFFNDAVKREYNHEHLHELVAFNDRPMHGKLRPDLGNAWCSKDKFFQLTQEEQAQTALEEIMATAIERSKLKSADQNSTKFFGMTKAHFKLCTSMTKGWFALYLIENRNNLLFKRREQWQTKLNQALTKLT
jgi:hypothetical protein